MSVGPQVKGMAVRGTLDAIRRLCPSGTVDKMLPLLPTQVAPAVEHDSFISAGWYPLVHYRAIFGAAMQATGRDIDLVRELGRFSTQQDFRGIYRLLTFVLSPEFLMRRSPGIFGRYYDTGSLTVEVPRDGVCEAQYRDCVGFDRVLWEDVIAGSSTILEVCGAREIKVTRVRGGGDGDDELHCIAEWR